MPYIRVRPQQLKKSAESIGNIQRDLQRIDDSFYNAGHNLEWQVRAADEVDQYIRKIRNELDEEVYQLMRMQKFLLQAGNQYDELDQKYLMKGQEKSGSGSASDGNTAPVSTEDKSLKDIYSMLLDRMKKVTTLTSKATDIKELGLIGKILGYQNSLVKLFDEEEYGEVKIANLIKSSAEVWKSFYTVKKAGLKDKQIQKLLEMKLGTAVDCVDVGGEFAGWLGSLIKVMRTEAYKDVSEFEKSTVDLLKTVMMLGETSAKANCVAMIWVSIIKSGLDTTNQAVESLQKYLEDGELTLGEVANIGVESSVKGLNTLLSSISFGALSLENIANLTPEQAADALKSGASSWGEKAGNYVLSHPELKREYDNASGWKKSKVLLYAIFKSCQG